VSASSAQAIQLFCGQLLPHWVGVSHVHRKIEALIFQHSLYAPAIA
jgi:hypothetical protein